MIDVIAMYWAQGKSLNAIAGELRLSRGVLAGQIHRARKSGDTRFPARPTPLKKAAVARPRWRRKPLVVTPSPPGREPPIGRKLLIDLPTDGCRYPTGVADDGRHVFCGRRRAPGRPYCRWCDEALSVSSASASSPRAPLRQLHHDERERAVVRGGLGLEPRDHVRGEPQTYRLD